MTKADLKIDWATHEAAKYACENWHYSRSSPATITKPLKIGVWENGVFIGVIVYTVGVGATLHSGYGVDRSEVCELQRVALKSHASPVSRMIAISLKKITKFDGQVTELYNQTEYLLKAIHQPAINIVKMHFTSHCYSCYWLVLLSNPKPHQMLK